MPESSTPPPAVDEAIRREWITRAVQEFEKPLMRYAVSQLGGHVELAREVVQDTFLKLWQADQTTVRSHLAPWLYTVCRNRMLDVRRKERRMTTLGDGLAATLAEADGGTSRTADNTAMLNHSMSFADGLADRCPDSSKHAIEQFQRIQELIEHLPERQREALRLKFQGDLCYRDIAGVLGITVNHVGVLLHTALKTLREQLSADGEQWIGSNATAAR